MEQIDLKHLIERHPEVLTDHTKLKAYILDLYPNCKRGMVNILVAIQQCGIVAEMQASKNPSALEISRWKKCLEDDVGFTGALAETCLEMWCSAIGIQEKEKAKSTAMDPISNEKLAQIEKRVSEIITECANRAIRLIEENRELAAKIVKQLIRQYSLTREEIGRIYQSEKGKGEG